MKSVKKHRILEAGDFSLVRYHSGMIYLQDEQLRGNQHEFAQGACLKYSSFDTNKPLAQPCFPADTRSPYFLSSPTRSYNAAHSSIELQLFKIRV